MSATVTPLEPHVGAEITGMSAGDLVSRRAADDCLAALQQYGVLVYREVHIDDDGLIAFSRMLGEVAVVPTGEHEYPEIQTITFDPSKTNALLASYRQGNFLWHIDGATEAVPQKSTLLSAREVDDAGGDTEFASTYAAYDALPEADTVEISDLRVVHSFAAAQLRANPDASSDERTSWERVPTRVHPLVWTHRGGRKSLLLGATAAEVVGWPPDKGRALLDRLLEWSTQPQFVLRHHWRPGDLVTWDNTGMLHRALPFEPTSRRLLHRTTPRRRRSRRLNLGAKMSIETELEELRRDVQYLKDRAAVLDCIATHARGCDRHDVAVLTSAYHDDSIDEHGTAHISGPEYAEWANAAHAATSDTHLHNITTHTCEIDGDEAHAESYVLVALLANDGKTATMMCGRYIDRLERRDGAWKIAVRRSTVELAFTADSSLLQFPFFKDLGYIKGTRDRDDLSYVRPLSIEAAAARW